MWVCVTDTDIYVRGGVVVHANADGSAVRWSVGDSTHLHSEGHATTHTHTDPKRIQSNDISITNDGWWPCSPTCTEDVVSTDLSTCALQL